MMDDGLQIDGPATDDERASCERIDRAIARSGSPRALRAIFDTIFRAHLSEAWISLGRMGRMMR